MYCIIARNKTNKLQSFILGISRSNGRVNLVYDFKDAKMANLKYKFTKDRAEKIINRINLERLISKYPSVDGFDFRVFDIST